MQLSSFFICRFLLLCRLLLLDSSRVGRGLLLSGRRLLRLSHRGLVRISSLLVDDINLLLLLRVRLLLLHGELARISTSAIDASRIRQWSLYMLLAESASSALSSSS